MSNRLVVAGLDRAATATLLCRPVSGLFLGFPGTGGCVAAASLAGIGEARRASALAREER